MGGHGQHRHSLVRPIVAPATGKQRHFRSAELALVASAGDVPRHWHGGWNQGQRHGERDFVLARDSLRLLRTTRKTQPADCIALSYCGLLPTTGLRRPVPLLLDDDDPAAPSSACRCCCAASVHRYYYHARAARAAAVEQARTTTIVVLSSRPPARAARGRSSSSAGAGDEGG